jgi:hypothetical protein
MNYYIIFEFHSKILALEKNQIKFVFLLAYSYLCTYDKRTTAESKEYRRDWRLQ